MMLAALDRLRGTGAEFGGFLSNHGPMAADAMIRLGGGEHVERWVEQYRDQLAPHPTRRTRSHQPTGEHNLGRIDRLGDWDSYFRRQLDRRAGWQAVLADWWPRLLPGAAAGAAHGLIRTAHAVRNLVDSDDTDPLLARRTRHRARLLGGPIPDAAGQPELSAAASGSLTRSPDCPGSTATVASRRPRARWPAADRCSDSTGFREALDALGAGNPDERGPRRR